MNKETAKVMSSYEQPDLTHGCAICRQLGLVGLQSGGVADMGTHGGGVGCVVRGCAEM